MVRTVRILIVDDQPRARQSLRALLSTWPVPQILWEARDGREAIELVDEYHPHVVLMDICMPEMDGLETTRIIKARWPWVKVVILTLYGEYEGEAMAAGADAFVGKGEPPARLLAILSAIATSCPHESQ